MATEYNHFVDHDELAVEHVPLAVARAEGAAQGLHDVLVHAVDGLPVAREEPDLVKAVASVRYRGAIAKRRGEG